MQFGRVEQTEGVRFGAPALDARSRRVLTARAGAESPDWLRVGGPAWARRDWVGSLYPPGTPPEQFLHRYARALDAIELNATGYAPPDERAVAQWRAETPATFRFCPKVPRSITHERGLVGAEAETDAFCERVAGLGPRLGPCLLQLPPSFGPYRLPALAGFLRRWRRDLPLCVEVRHPSWFVRGALLGGVRDLLEATNVGTVITDVAGRRDVCHGSVTAPFVVVRFVATAEPESDAARGDEWVDALFAWRAAGLASAFLFVHAPDDRLAPAILAHVVDRARQKGAPLSPLSLAPAQRQLDLFGA